MVEMDCQDCQNYENAETGCQSASTPKSVHGECMASAAQSSPGPRPLSLGHFRKIAGTGFGDGRNTYAWSCAWFHDHVYIGTNRHVLVVSKKRIPVQVPYAVYPVPIPEGDEFLDQRSEIWRYNPRTEVWQRVFRSPLIEGLQGRLAPLAGGFRNMAVFQGKSDPAPVIYTIPGCTSRGIGPVLLRSEDGEHFEVASEPGLGLGDANVISYRGAVPLKGRLFISPAASRGGHVNTSYNLTVLCSDDPVSGRWEVSNPGTFGDPTNFGIFDMAACNGYLYAGLINVRHGCQVWKTDGEGPPPHRWTKVADSGFDRGPLNEAIAGFASFQGDLYVGTGIQYGGYDRFNNIGPAAAEVIRIHPDDSWDLVVGEPRMTRAGFMTPSSGLGPGFNNPVGGYVWRLTVHDGVLYAGTFDAASHTPFSDPTTWPDSIRHLLDASTLERFMKVMGGCELWRTTTGDDWAPITRNGFGNPFNQGIRALLTTPIGLFVGTANPFGPQVAVHGPAGWRYEPNPRGGLEIYHGSLKHSPITRTQESLTSLTDSNPWSHEDGSIPYAHLASLALEGGRRNDCAPERDERLELLHALTELACADALKDRHKQFAIQDEESQRDQADRHHPLRRLSEVPKGLVGLSEDVVDELAAYFAGDLHNVGYWREEGLSPRQACAQLVVELLAFLPPTTTGTREPSILAVGSKPEGLRRQLAELIPSASITALDGDTLARAPTPFPVADSVVDLVVWIEGPGAVDRLLALSEARRVLKPGGRLLAADLLAIPIDREPPSACDIKPSGQIEAYKNDLTRAGFDSMRLVDVTRNGWQRFFRHSREFFATKLAFQQIDKEQHDRILAALPGGRLIVAANLLVSAVAGVTQCNPGS
jgi:hypothetical protein